MANEPDDAELGRRFMALRAAETRRHVACFEPTWARAEARAATRPRFRPRALVATGALAVAALLILFVWRWPDRPIAVDISGWQSPTDFLLRSPGDAILRDLPTLGASAIPTITVANVPGGTP